MTTHHPGAADFLPPRLTLNTLVRAAATCTGCDLHHLGTQTVFGEGPTHARVMMVGEQPGDREDLEGHPFVGPAGRLLDRALAESGIDREDVYLTNAVKHFRWGRLPGKKKRIHRKPTLVQVAACRPWLDAEIKVVRPEIVVCLGATAAQALLGSKFRVTQHRGEVLEVPDLGAPVTATVHPASILRASDDAARRREMDAFVRDLTAVRRSVAA
ncbi:MAG TPA: UdgX family uracil-DNA binding protein [Actinomycetota bacterium]